jgi:hypothetical protein
MIRSNVKHSLVIGILWTPDYFTNHFSGLFFAVLSELHTEIWCTIPACRGIRVGIPTFIPILDLHQVLGNAVRDASPLDFHTAFPPYLV